MVCPCEPENKIFSLQTRIAKQMPLIAVLMIKIVRIKVMQPGDVRKTHIFLTSYNLPATKKKIENQSDIVHNFIINRANWIGIPGFLIKSINIYSPCV